MFTYLDPTVRKRLVEEGKLIRMDRDGNTLAPDETTGGQAISMLGPIPLPLHLGDREFAVDWYACVRNTELSKVEELADQPDVICRGGSVIVSPLGEVLAGPLWDEEGILTADLDLDEVTRGKLDFDVVGHYARSDIFQLVVNEKPIKPVLEES